MKLVKTLRYHYRYRFRCLTFIAFVSAITIFACILSGWIHFGLVLTLGCDCWNHFRSIFCTRTPVAILAQTRPTATMQAAPTRKAATCGTSVDRGVLGEGGWRDGPPLCGRQGRLAPANCLQDLLRPIPWQTCSAQLFARFAPSDSLADLLRPFVY